MLKKLIVTLIASAFALTAFAQSSTTAPSSPAAAEKKMDKKAAKGEKKAKAKSSKSKSKGKAKSDAAKK